MIPKIKKFYKEFKFYQYVIAGIATVIFLSLSIYYFASYKTSNIYNVDFSTLKIEENDSENIISLNGISLPKGEYSLAFGYNALGSVQFNSMIDNDVIFNETLTPTDGNIASRQYDFELKMGTDRGRMSFTSSKESPVELAFITIASTTHIYKDGLIWGILALIMIPFAWVAVYFFDKNSHKISLATVAILVVAQIVPFIAMHGLVRGVDTRAHMMRIEGIYYGLLDGQYPVIVQPEFNNSYGQIGVLYPSLFLYIPALFRVFGMSQLGVAKLYLLIVIGAGAIIAFAASRSIFKRDWQVCLSCICLLAGNMRLYDLYLGGKIGGSLLAEMFWPLVVAGAIELFYRNRKKWYLLAYGMAGTFCCHVTSATVACFFLLFMTLFCVKKLSEDKVRRGIGNSILLFIALTFGTAVCFLNFYFGEWGQEKLQWRDFLSTLWNVHAPFADGRWTSVLIILLITLGLLIFIIIKDGKDKLEGSFVPAVLGTGVILFYMSTAYFPWKMLMNIPAVQYYTNMLQSGNRFLSLAGCTIVMCIPELLEIVIHRKEGRRSFNSKTWLIVSIGILIVAMTNLEQREMDYFDNKTDLLYVDEVVGEVEYAFDDYLPKGTESEWYQSDAGFVSDETAVQSLAYERLGTYIYYSYTNTAKGAYVEFPKFYYNGYRAEDEMADPVTVYKGDKNRIRIYLKETEMPAIIRVWYYVPWYFTLATAFSMGAWIFSLILVGYRVIKKID